MFWAEVHPATYRGLDGCNVISIRSIRSESLVQSLIANGPLCECECVAYVYGGRKEFCQTRRVS